MTTHRRRGTAVADDRGVPEPGQPQQPPPQQPPPSAPPPPPAIGSSAPTPLDVLRATSDGSRTLSVRPHTHVTGASAWSGARSSSAVWPQARQRYS
jgi:hypothetical protein